MNIYIIIITIVFIVLILIWLLNPYNVLTLFFGIDHQRRTNAEILKYIGAICGGLILFFSLFKPNPAPPLEPKNPIDTELTNALNLLESKETSKCLSGIGLLKDLMLNSSPETGYKKRIYEIFCAFIRENSIIARDTTGTLIEAQNVRPTQVIQSLMDLLFRDENLWGLDRDADLSNSVFIDLDLDDAIFDRVNFEKSYFENVRMKFTRLYNTKLESAYLKNVDFNLSTLSNINLCKSLLKEVRLTASTLNQVGFDSAILINTPCVATRMSEVSFIKSKIKEVNLSYAQITNSNFYHAELEDAYFIFSNLQTVSFSKSVFKNVSFKNAIFNDRIDFTETSLWKHSIESILENSSLLTSKGII